MTKNALREYLKGTLESNQTLSYRRSLKYFVLFIQKADMSLFWKIWGPQRLQREYKIGRKLPLGTEIWDWGWEMGMEIESTPSPQSQKMTV